MHAVSVGAASAAMGFGHAAAAIAPEGAPTGLAQGDGVVGAASAAMGSGHAAAAIAPEGAPTGTTTGEGSVGAASAAIQTSCGTAFSSTATGLEGANAPHGADLRIGRTSIIGQTYSITAVTHERRRFFDDHRLARTVIRTLRSLSEVGIAHTHGFVVMPDHFHWLLTLRGGTLSTLMARAKGRSARQVNLLLGRVGMPIWQRGFHDRALRRDEDVRQVARYIVSNPLRAGLVRAIGDYPWWDAEWL